MLIAAPLLSSESHSLKENQDLAPRFQVVRGKGWSVCERYARFLNAQAQAESPPLSHLQPSPKLKEADWETLDLQKHLNVICTIQSRHEPRQAATSVRALAAGFPATAVRRAVNAIAPHSSAAGGRQSGRNPPGIRSRPESMQPRRARNGSYVSDAWSSFAKREAMNFAVQAQGWIKGIS